LPLIQEQQQKKQILQQIHEQKKQKEVVRDVDIDSFKPSGGLNDDFFADLDDSKQQSNANEQSKDDVPIEMNGHTDEMNGYLKDEIVEKSKQSEEMLSDLNGKKKLQSLMKLKSAQIESSESEEFDDEPLVFAKPKPIVHKIQSPEVVIAKEEKIEIKMEKEEFTPIDMSQNEINEQEEDINKDDDNGHVNEKPQSIDDGVSENESDNEKELEAERKRQKEERKRRKREKREKKKKRKKKKRKKKDRDDDIVEFDDSD